MPYRPNIIPQRSPGFLSSITNSLSFLALGAGGTAGNSKSVSAGGNLAELRCELLRLCELQEMPGCSVGGRAGPGPASLSGQAQGKLGGSFVSPRAIWILYLAAGGPQHLGMECLPSQDPSFRGSGEAECALLVPRRLRGCCLTLGGVSGQGPTGLSLQPLRPKGFSFLALRTR